MKDKASCLLKNKGRGVCVLSFPLAHFCGYEINDIVSDASAQAEIMKYIAENFSVGAVCTPMDLSVEAEAFGAEISFSRGKIPEVSSVLISDISLASGLEIPSVESGRCSVFSEGVKRAKNLLGNLPVIAGVIGPYSLACRLRGITDFMLDCIDDEDSSEDLLEKITVFLKKYIRLLKKSGADGILLAEPAAGLLSPSAAQRFSNCYVKEIFDEFRNEDFLLGYHNCGSSVNNMPALLAQLEADFYHFGNAVDIAAVIPFLPHTSIVMGNIDPVLLKNGSENEIRQAVENIFDSCSQFDNFMISPGCDIPAEADISKIKLYFDLVSKHYE